MGKVLIVDDEPDFLDLLKGNLESSGFQIETANGGFQALKRIKELKDIDCILTDYYMPQMRGDELAMMIRHESDIPVIVMTADPNIQFDRMYRSGISGVLTKPIDAGTFTEFLKQNDLHLDDQIIKQRKFLRNTSGRGEISLTISNGRQSFQVQLENLSTHGMGVLLPELDIGLSTMQFTLVRGEETLTGFMHCRWQSALDENIKAGFEFDSITKKNLSKSENFYSWITANKAS